MEVNTHEGKKVFMVAISMLIGYWVLLIQLGETDKGVTNWSNLGIINTAVSIASAILYPLWGALAVRLSECLRKWGTKGVYSKWSEGDRLFFGGIWPATLLFSIIIYLYLGIINRLF